MHSTEEGIGCIVFSPLAQGLLSGRYLDGIPADSRANLPNTFLTPANVTEELIGQTDPIERDRPGTRANPGADGHRLGAAPTAGHQCVDRCQPAEPDPGLRGLAQ